MAYDLRSQIYNLSDCIASANSPIARVAAGLDNFTQIFQISPSKLVLGGKLFIQFFLFFQTTLSFFQYLGIVMIINVYHLMLI
jgi:hypothetical protein